MPILLLLLLISSPLAAASCPNVGWDQTATVKRINDGDTITLENGRSVRFIGINTPEINHRNESKSEPYALQAKALVERYIKIGDTVHLVFDKTKQDKYGRLLAYVYSKGGQNLALLQLQSGLAKQWLVGQNERFWRCFQKTERQARLRKKGVWSNFKALRAVRISKQDRGYQYISGQISEITRSPKGVAFFLDRKLKVQISASNLHKFSANHIAFALHDKLLLTGKLTFSGSHPRLTLYHPVQLLP
ncbi:MAG: thermonuclease family protein [Psychromonas sp.]|nr:thermonuclease family protein [Psychromonas sp.]